MSSILNFDHYYDICKKEYKYDDAEKELIEVLYRAIEYDIGEFVDRLATVKIRDYVEIHMGDKKCDLDSYLITYLNTDYDVSIILDNKKTPYKHFNGIKIDKCRKDVEKIKKELSNRNDYLKKYYELLEIFELLLNTFNEQSIQETQNMISKTKKIIESDLEVGDTNLLTKIYKVISNIEKICPNDMPIYGEYNHKNREIILYLKNIVGSNNNLYKVESKLMSTLCHEYFHAYHHSMCEVYDNPWTRLNKHELITVESLAAYAEYYYLGEVLHDIRAQEEYRQLLAAYNLYVFPYSGAHYLILEDNKNIHTAFSRTLNDSISNLEYGFEDIIFYKKENVMKM